jgi:hypothetical protein
MKQTPILFLTVALLLVTAHRLPAPIQEVPESPTPAPTESAKPKPKRTTKPKVTTESSETVKQGTRGTAESTKGRISAQPQQRFSGTWKGILNGQQWMIVIDANETQAAASGGPWGVERGTTRINQNTISWKYVFNSWSLTVVPGTKTAQVTEQYIGGTSSGTFEKTN